MIKLLYICVSLWLVSRGKVNDSLFMIAREGTPKMRLFKRPAAENALENYSHLHWVHSMYTTCYLGLEFFVLPIHILLHSRHIRSK